jgi:hypothetical protein
MYNYYINLKTEFRGYKKSQVDHYIREQLFQNFTTLSELSIKVIQLEGEKKQLEATSMKLKNDLMAYMDESLPANLFVHLFETIDKQKNIPSPKVVIKKVSEESSLTNKMNVTTDIIKSELGTLSGKVDALASRLDQLASMQSSNAESAVRKEAVDEEYLRLLQPMPAEAAITEEQTAATIDNGNVEEVDFNKEAAHSKKQENGVPKNERGKILNFTRINSSIQPATVGHSEQKEQTNSFWGLAVNGYPKTDISNLIIHPGELFDYTEVKNDFTRNNSFFDNIKIPSANTEPSPKKLPSKKQNTAPVKPDLNASIDVSVHVQESTSNKTVLSEDAKYIRQKYVIGKIAGEDLYDRNGKLIIGRKSLITSQVVDYADKEGKLPELIINMILRNTE